MLKINKFYFITLMSVFLFAFLLHPAFVAAETALWEIYNTLYGTSLTSNQELWDNYGYVCSDTGGPCTVATEATDCPGTTCDHPIDDGVFEETNGYVMAGARYADYTQVFGYYTGLFTGGDPLELFDVTTTGYLFECSAESQNPGASCIVDGDCPDGTCDPLYDSLFLVGGDAAVIGFYCDSSGSPRWYSQPELNVDGNNDHMWTFRTPYYTLVSPEYLLAWEDLNLGDADYNDLVVVTNHLEPHAIERCEVNGDCDDGLYCNGNETCDVGSGTCQAGSDPCPDDGLYCTGMEGCDEDNDVCTQSGNPCTPESCDEANDTCAEAECVALTIGSADGAPGETDVPVEVGLTNLNDKVIAVQVDVCDEGNYLTCTECEAEDARAAFFRCSTNELANGCCRVILVTDRGILIDEGTGTILTIRYDVKGNAPGGCTDLNPESAKVSDEIEDPLAVCVSSGKFCFFVCGDIYPDDSSPGANDCGDGVTDIFDVIEATDIVLGIGVHSDCQLIRADVPNGIPPDCRDPNGEIDLFDILVIIDVVLNRENCCDDYYGPTKCTTDADCNDGLYCNGEETCDIGSGICQAGINPCSPPLVCDEDDNQCKEVPPEICDDGEDNDGDGFIDCEDPDCDGFACDDGLYCTEGEICVEGVCAGEDRDCDDGLYCTGIESCDEENDQCLSSGNPCPPGYLCNEGMDTCDIIPPEICDDGEDNDGDGFIDCEDPDCDGFACDDGLYCTEGEICVEGVCEGEDRDCMAAGDQCNDGVCDDGLDQCIAQPVSDGTTCDDGLYCTEGEICVEGVCEGEDRDCDDGLYCTGIESCDEENDQCTTTGSPCDDSNECTDDMCYEVDDSCSNVCNASSSDDPCCEDPVCADAPQCMPSITIDPGDAMVPSGVVKVPLCLINLEDPVGAVQVDLCESNDDCLECVECELTERTTLFDCVVNELDNGCCRVIIFSKNPGGVINPGECNIATVVYLLDPACSLTECETLTVTNMVVTDQYAFEMDAAGLTGSVCPFVCGDVEPGESFPGANDCGDGDVDIFDILEEVALALGEKTPAACQTERANVPTGTPPFCNAPDEVINVVDIMVIIDMALDRPDCCSYYYLGEFF